MYLSDDYEQLTRNELAKDLQVSIESKSVDPDTTLEQYIHACMRCGSIQLVSLAGKQTCKEFIAACQPYEPTSLAGLVDIGHDIHYTMINGDYCAVIDNDYWIIADPENHNLIY